MRNLFRTSRISNLFRTLLCLASAASVLPTLAADEAPWWNKDWASRRKITIDTSKVENLSESVSTPVLLRLHDGNFNFPEAKEDGGDLRLVSLDGKTVLPIFVEKFDPVINNQGYIWTRTDALGPKGSTQFYVYYSNKKAEATSVSDPAAVQDDNIVLNYHFAEAGNPVDSSATGVSASTVGTWVEGGFIGGATGFKATDAVTVPNVPAFTFPANGAMTMSVWVKLTAPGAGSLLTYGNAATGLNVSVDQAGVPALKVAGQASPTTTPLALNTWTHLAVVASAAKIDLYVGGKVAATSAVGLPALTEPKILLGKNESGLGFNGEMDEFLVSKTAQSASWVSFVAFTQGSEAQDKAIITDKEEIVKMSWLDGNDTSAVLIRSLTADGWVVIVICFFMAIGSWYIMFTKIRMLGHNNKGNSIFMTNWRKLSRDLTALDNTSSDSIKTMGGLITADQMKDMKASSVYRLYHVGAEELRHRLEADGGKDAGISARSMEAIKATMDGGQVREGQRLNKLIVLLTICISGGPFLGLLGTVIGVMITFAAIAAAGDVNVNSIAPGIAGALLATVAGLAVAIPALFGYNFILAKVKEATADMAVFIDEFVTRMAENYPDSKSNH